MKARFILLAALFAPPAAARAGAYDDLAGGAPREMSVPAASPAGAVRQAALPDESVAEDLPSAPEVLALAPICKSVPPEFNFDPRGVIPAGLRGEAYEQYRARYGQFGNTRYLAVIDFSQYSGKARFYIADTEQGTVKVYHVAHGSGSDPDHDGYATIFSNKPDSNSSSLGLYLTGETYYGKHGKSMRLHGLSDTNSNAYARAVVIHAADYVSDSDVKPGRSWGCPAVSAASLPEVLSQLDGGALIYAGLSR